MFSPSSLFNAPSTPKQNSGKLEVFEWTIEDISSFNPVNLIPHETQFREEIDPDHEAEVQAAISSFFNEHQIVPSPKASTSTRLQKIEFKTDIYNSTALSLTNNNNNNAQVSSTDNNCHISSIRKIKVSDNNIKIKCDNSTQTDLSFPPILPKEIEDLLNRFKINSDNKKHDDIEENENACDRSMMDISTLRRKLFIKPPESPEFNVSCSDEAFANHLSPAPRTPQLARSSRHLQLIEENVIDGDNSLNSDMFGELSPISIPNGSFDCSSPMSSPTNDISMLSDGKIFYFSYYLIYFQLIFRIVRENKTPASRRRCSLLRKKNLSESFSMLQNEFNEEIYSEQENCDLHITLPAPTTDRKPFARFDSGFRGDEDSNSIQLNFSAELMQI